METNSVVLKFNDAWNAVSSALSTLYSAPAIMLVLISCFAWGWVLKRWRRFPNEGIPIFVMSWGAIFTPLLADPFAGKPIPFRIWLGRNALIGFIIGFASWMIHRYVWKPALRKARTMFPTWFDDDSDPRAFVKAEMEKEKVNPNK